MLQIAISANVRVWWRHLVAAQAVGLPSVPSWWVVPLPRVVPAIRAATQTKVLHQVVAEVVIAVQVAEAHVQVAASGHGAGFDSALLDCEGKKHSCNIDFLEFGKYCNCQN